TPPGRTSTASRPWPPASRPGPRRCWAPPTPPPPARPPARWPTRRRWPAPAPRPRAPAVPPGSCLAGPGDKPRDDKAADLYEQVPVAHPTWVVAVAGLAHVLM